MISTLSYSATTRAVFEHYSAFMIDEERVVGLKVS